MFIFIEKNIIIITIEHFKYERIINVKKIELNKYKKMLIGIIILYAFVSFIKLGNIDSPKTFVNFENGESIIFKVEDGCIPKEMVFFTGSDNVYLSVYLADEYSEDEDDFEFDTSVTSEYSEIFSWKKVDINEEYKECSYIMLSSYSDSTMVGEVAFLDEFGEYLSADIVSGSDLLVDEQDIIHTKNNYMNSTYFDEVYFPRASYEMFNNKYIFEYTHPPLGKVIMWIPMAIFGISPFTYRVMGNIAGILMILVMYGIAKELFKDEKYAVFAALIIALDGMHFAQTRIATVDSFLVLFCLISVLYFIRYVKFKDNNKKRYTLLAISGLMWGCAVSVKWISCYLGLGLGIIFFIDYIFNKKIVLNKKFNYLPILMGIVCFVIIPIIVYVLSYIPVFMDENEVAVYDVTDENGITTQEVVRPDSLKNFLLYQYSMFQYHSNIGKGEDYHEHPFTSKWYTWPISYKPMWFYTNSYDDNMKSTIVTMGNPAIWWLSIGTALFMLVYSIIKRDKIGFFILILILSTWLPFAFVSREMYIYHYFLTSIFMMLSIVFTVARLVEWKDNLKILIPLLTCIFLITFVYFYPVYSGMVVSEKYIQSTKWLDSWVY